MKKFLKYLIPALIVGSSLLGVVHAQVSTPNYWKTNVSSSTISPINSALQVPCANIVGGCSSGTTAMTAFPTPTQLASGTTCGTTANVTEVGNCFGDILSAAATGTLVFVGPYTYPSSSWTNPINIGTNQKFLSISCVPNVSTFKWGGTGTSTIWNYGNSASASGYAAHTYGVGPTSCTFYGPGANSTTTWAVIGGTNGAEGFSALGNRIQGFGLGIFVSNNIYLPNINFNQFVNNGQNIESTSSLTNTGERFNMLGNLFGDVGGSGLTSSTLEHCVDLNGLIGLNYSFNSTDDCGITIHASSVGNTLSNDYWENPQAFSNSSYPAYHYLTIIGSTLASINLTDDTMTQDASSTTSTVSAFISNGASLNINGLTAWTNGSDGASTTQQLVTESAATSQLYAAGVVNSTSSGTGALGFVRIDQNAATATVGLQLAPYSDTGNSSFTFSVSTGTVTGYVSLAQNMQSGQISIGPISTAGDTLTFGKTWNKVPTCTMTNASGSGLPNIIRWQTITTTTDSFGDSVNLATNTIVDFICVGNPN